MAGVVWVGVSLRPRPRLPEGQTATAPAASPDGKPQTHMVEFKHTRLKEGRTMIIRAKESEGSEQEGVRLRETDISFTYSVKGKLEQGSIVSDTGLYNPMAGTATFDGHVNVKTADGFSLETDSLSYDDKGGLARTEAPVTFKRKDVSGSGRGLVYDASEGTVQLDADVVIRIADEDGTTEVRSRRAFLKQAEHTIRFVGEAVMTKGADVLRSDELIVNFDDEGHAVQRAEAIGAVHAEFSSRHGMGPVDETGGSGRRELRGQKLDIFFRPDRTLEKMEAGPDGKLTIHPGPKDPPEVRHLSSRMLTFFFDEAGRLSEVQGHKDSAFASEPRGARKNDPAGKRTMRCQNFVARFDVTTGQLDNGDFLKDVKFTWPDGEATAATARYELHRTPGGLLMMKTADEVRPELKERRNGSRLTAVALDLEVETGNVAARREVRHVIPPRGAGASGLVGAEAETVITSRLFRYEPRRATASYTDDAILRSGTDEVRGEKITVEQDGAVVRAEQEVVTILTPKDKDQDKGPVEARANDMLYRKAANRIDYSGSVWMKHGDVTTESPKSTVFLTPEGRGFQRLEAGSPVKIVQAEQTKRQATATWVTYHPADKRVTLNGRAHLVDEQGQVVRGDLVTFRLDQQTIMVEGREARSETILKKEVAVP